MQATTRATWLEVAAAISMPLTTRPTRARCDRFLRRRQHSPQPAAVIVIRTPPTIRIALACRRHDQWRRRRLPRWRQMRRPEAVIRMPPTIRIGRARPRLGQWRRRHLPRWRQTRRPGAVIRMRPIIRISRAGRHWHRPRNPLHRHHRMPPPRSSINLRPPSPCPRRAPLPRRTPCPRRTRQRARPRHRGSSRLSRPTSGPFRSALS